MKGSHKVSILQGKEKACYVTGRTDNLHKHHIYFGTGRRAVSDKYGFWVWLTAELHNCSNYGVHGKNGHELDIFLKQKCQQAFEKENSRAEFLRIIGKNYLD